MNLSATVWNGGLGDPRHWLAGLVRQSDAGGYCEWMGWLLFSTYRISSSLSNVASLSYIFLCLLHLISKYLYYLALASYEHFDTLSAFPSIDPFLFPLLGNNKSRCIRLSSSSMPSSLDAGPIIAFPTNSRAQFLDSCQIIPILRTLLSRHWPPRPEPIITQSIQKAVQQPRIPHHEASHTP